MTYPFGDTGVATNSLEATNRGPEQQPVVMPCGSQVLTPDEEEENGFEGGVLSSAEVSSGAIRISSLLEEMKFI